MNALLVEWRADVLPKMGTVTIGTVVRTIGQVDCKGRFVRNFLKYDVEIVEFKHEFRAL